jgi:hypothetical protein
MEKTAQANELQARGGFNIHKLQATLCILSSSAVSIGLIYWAIKTLF